MLYVASIAKQFIAAAIASLVLTRTVSVNDSIRQWIAELGAAWDPVHLDHLLLHTGGLRDRGRLGTPTEEGAGQWASGSGVSKSEPCVAVVGPTPADFGSALVDLLVASCAATDPDRWSPAVEVVPLGFARSDGHEAVIGF